ncbi:heavy metal translocating P-type ATPase [Vogesella sp. DC21W]|uniref:Heavy metal translocating P-type ATPase n=1 Tax=Vogesella aquatica TaxID=2984206 RepID=A0ABT5IYI0_9NEIS|nr:heavy metal translocating P-type ATPase [Vogesella aquatica]MDC7717610.1 heavy metal translocating P-type ATPase [Vogesella aquatica]
MNPTCFHCSLPIPAGQAFPIRYRERTEQACCAGCQAVAQTIIDSGLADYYEHRTAEQRQAEPVPAELLQQMQLYDNEALQHSFVHVEDEHIREASLMLEGITCAACVWLNEHHVRKLPGVLSVDINYATHRARVRWDVRQLKLSQILEAISAIGYRAHPYDASRQEALHQKERKTALNRLWVAGLSMMQVMMYAYPVYMAPDGEIESQWLWMLHWSSFVLTLPVVLYSAIPFYRGTWRDLKRGRVGMDTPVTIGILTAFLASLWALLNKIEHGVYFDSVSMFIFLLLGGRYLESMARRKTGEATEKLVKLIPAFAHAVPGWPQDQAQQEVAVSQLAVGDVVLVKPGETIPCDGDILEGHSSVDEALLTGESTPITKQAGDSVIAGSVNQASPLLLRLSRTGSDTRLAGIVRLMDQALAEKPRLAELADRYAVWFVTVLLLAAAATYIGWSLAGSQEHALWVTVAVLVVSCPCALSLATPAALTAATGHMAQLGILTTRGHALETLARISDVVFDKTGTLTHGRMQLLASHGFSHPNAGQALAIAAALEQGSEHPIARALLHATADSALPACGQRSNQPGQGVEADITGQRWRLGRPAFVAGLSGSFSLPDELPASATIIALGDARGVAAVFAIGDQVRDDSAALIRALQARGLRVHLLSGDADKAVASLASQLHIADYRAAATPEDKLAYVSQLQQGGARVLMVGDGVNDAPVLARADVSLAMGGGTDVARASGDMVLMGDELGRLPQALGLAARSMHIIRQNLAWAALYNLVALPLAMAGWVTPWLASLGMALSSLLVVSNALRLTKRSK